MSEQAIERRPFVNRRGDLRQSAGRRWHQLFKQLANEIGGELSPAREQLLKRLCTVLYISEQNDERVTQGEAVALADVLRTSSEARSLMFRLGLAVPAKDAKPDEDDDLIGDLLDDDDDD